MVENTDMYLTVYPLCLICDYPLTGKQKKYCSEICSKKARKKRYKKQYWKK